MARKHPPYTPEFRRQMIELVRSGRRPEQLAKEFEPTAQAIRNWVAQADRDGGSRDGNRPKRQSSALFEIRLRDGRLTDSFTTDWNCSY